MHVASNRMSHDRVSQTTRSLPFYFIPSEFNFEFFSSSQSSNKMYNIFHARTFNSLVHLAYHRWHRVCVCLYLLPDYVRRTSFTLDCVAFKFRLRYTYALYVPLICLSMYIAILLEMATTTTPTAEAAVAMRSSYFIFSFIPNKTLRFLLLPFHSNCL